MSLTNDNFFLTVLDFHFVVLQMLCVGVEKFLLITHTCSIGILILKGIPGNSNFWGIKYFDRSEMLFYDY